MGGGIEIPKESNKNVPMTPLPTWQVFAVCMVEVCEGININVLFPFLAFMVEDLGHTGSSLGYYAGGLAGAFCGAQFCSSVLWGKISDTYGRKPAIFFGTLGTALGMLVFGTSKTYAQAIMGRVLSGFLCGNLGVVKSFLTEITDETNRAKGFSLFSLGWFVGTVLAPITGGFLCRPADKYPQYFSQDGLFGTYPYLLPCLMCACFNTFSAVVCWLVMVETRTPERRTRSSSSGSLKAATGSSGKTIEMTVSSSSSSKSSSGSGRTTLSSSSSSSGKEGGSVKSPLQSRFTILAGDEEEDELELGRGEGEEDGFGDPREAEEQQQGYAMGSGRQTGGGKYVKVASAGEVGEDEDLTDDDNSISPNTSSAVVSSADKDGWKTFKSVSSVTVAEAASGPTLMSEKEQEELCCPAGGFLCCRPASELDPTDSLTVLRHRNVLLTCSNYGILAMAYIILEETIPLFLKLETPLGGFGFNSIQIGILLSISGGVMLFFTLLLLPKISCHSKVWLMRVSCLWAIPLGFAWPLLALLYTNVLAPLDVSEGVRVGILWPLLVLVTVFKSVMSCLAFTAVMMQINHSVFDEHLGSVNGLGQSFASLSRAVGPALGGMLWSASIEWHFVFFNFLAFGAILLACVYMNALLPPSIDVKKHPKLDESDLHGEHCGV